jgi:superfamily I DNA and/or RNA helicase
VHVVPIHGYFIVLIEVTDNYQGEENEIIILSLVRSNLQKSIGFLKMENRICVALSRARSSFFIIGNMTLLSESSDMWKRICKTLIDHNQIGSG